jgi:hypothetical protein
MSGDPGHAGPGDVLAMERIFELDEEEADAVEEAFIYDLRAHDEAIRRRHKERVGDE